MAIGSCTSCHSSANHVQPAREQQNVDRINDVASERASIQEEQQVQESFRPEAGKKVSKRVWFHSANNYCSPVDYEVMQKAA